MGYSINEVAVAYTYECDGSTKRVEDWRDSLPDDKTGMGRGFRQYLKGPFRVVNGKDMWVFIPDGSKDGWDEQETCTKLREEFLKVAQATPYNAIWVRFGGDFDRDNDGPEILFPNEAARVKQELDDE